MSDDKPSGEYGKIPRIESVKATIHHEGQIYTGDFTKNFNVVDVKNAMTLEGVIKYVCGTIPDPFGDALEASHYMDVEGALGYAYNARQPEIDALKANLQRMESNNAMAYKNVELMEKDYYSMLDSVCNKIKKIGVMEDAIDKKNRALNGALHHPKCDCGQCAPIQEALQLDSKRWPWTEEDKQKKEEFMKSLVRDYISNHT